MTEGAAITSAIQVRFTDGLGNLVSSATDSVTVSISNNPGGGTLSGRTTVPAASGVATFPNLSIDKRGEAYTLTATAATGFAPAESFAFNVTCSCWSGGAPMPTARRDLGVGVINGVVYAVGGRAGSGLGILGTVEAYDPVTNSWTARAPMPTPRSALAVGVVNGVLYAVGGGYYPPTGNPDIVVYRSLATVEAYDPVIDLWTVKAPMPTSRLLLGVGVVNGVLYAIGGYDPSRGTTLGTVEAYDPVANVWTTKAPIPPSAPFGVGVVNGVLYAVGGGSLPTVAAYDPVADRWTTKAPMPTSRVSMAVGVVNGVLYALGGYDGGGYRATVDVYDPEANSWTSRGPMPTSRAFLGVGVVNSVLTAVGGANAAGDLTTLEGYDPAQDR